VRVLSLFSGIGAHCLGYTWAGMEIVGHCEIDPFCRKVLRKHWPEVPKIKDVKSITAEKVARACGHIDMIAASPPCQDISGAGKGEGIGTKETPTQRSGLFWETLRIIGEIRPRWVVIENVSAFRVRGADPVLFELEKLGYTCWTMLVGSWAVGAPHQRNRVFIVAYSPSSVRGAPRDSKRTTSSRSSKQLEHAECSGLERSNREGRSGKRRKTVLFTESNTTGMANSNCKSEPTCGVETGDSLVVAEQSGAQSSCNCTNVANPSSQRRQQVSRRPSCNEITYARWAAAYNNQLECDDEGNRSGEISLAGGEGLEGCWHRTSRPITQFPLPPGILQHAWEHPRTIDIEEETERALGATTPRNSRRLVRSRLVNWNKNVLKAVGNANPPALLYVIGTAIMLLDKELGNVG
jgi:DNA-cytosine methyltransferase